MAYAPGVRIPLSDTAHLISANALILVPSILILLIFRSPLWLVLLVLLILLIHITAVFTMDPPKRRWITNTNQDASDRSLAVDPVLAAGFHNLSCSPGT